MRTEDLYTGISGISDKWIIDADDSNILFAAANERKNKKERARFVGYELRKLLAYKYLWIFLLVLLMLNSAIAWSSAGNARCAAENRMIAQFVDGYFDSPEEYDAHYAKMKAFEEEQYLLMKEAAAAGNDNFEMQSYPNVYSTSDRISDVALFRALYSAIEKAESYRDKIIPIIESAERNLDSLPSIGADEGDYVYVYQQNIIEEYSKALDNVRMGVEYSYGWSNYFSYDAVNIFISIMIIMVAALTFAQEKQNGFLPVLRSAREGRLTTAIAKILAVLIMSSFIVLIFTASTFAIIGIKVGYSSPLNAIQSLDSFVLSPYCLTIGETFAATLAIKLIAAALLALLVAVLSVIFSNYAVIFVGGLVIWGTSFLLYTSKLSDDAARMLNLVGVMDATDFFVRYRSLNIFGNLCEFLPFIITVFTVLVIACAVFCTIMHTCGFGGVRFGFVDTVRAELVIAIRKVSSFFGRLTTKRAHSVRSYSSSLVSAEIFKTLISSRFIIALVLLLCVKVGYSAEVYSAPRSYSDEVYYEYMTRLEGQLTDEKLAYIAAERADINAVISAKEKMNAAYRNNEIGFEEYYDYLARYNYAESRDELLRIIEDHAKYLSESENGGWFVYDTGWQKLYSGDADLFLYTAILLILAGIFASEYFSRGEKGGFARILRSTKKGREQTFSAKLICAAVIALTLTLVMSAVDIFTIFSNFEMPALTAPLVSIREFSAVTTDLTIGGYMAVFLLLRITGALLMAMLVCALSELLCRYLPVLGTVIVLTLLPAFCVGFGISAAEPLNFLNLLAGTPILINSAETALFGSDWGMLAIWITAAAAAVGAVMMPARKMYVK